MSVELQLQPRPPVPGSESPPHAFLEEKLPAGKIQGGNLPGNIQGPDKYRQGPVGNSCPEKLKILQQPLLQTSSLKSAMAPSPKATSESGSLRGFEPEGSADVTPPFRQNKEQIKVESV